MTRWKLILLLVLFFCFSFPARGLQYNASLFFENENSTEALLSYDIYSTSGGTYYFPWTTSFVGSYSYKNLALENKRVLLSLCNLTQINLSIDYYASLAYANEEGGEVWQVSPLLVKLPEFNSTNHTGCFYVDMDIQSYDAIYPGVPFLYLTNTSELFTNHTIFIPVGNDSNQTGNYNETHNISSYIGSNILSYRKLGASIFNGSYLLRINLNGETYSVYANEIYDHLGRTIQNRNKDLLFSLVSNTSVVKETWLAGLNEAHTFTSTLEARDKIYVNGLLSLEVKAYEPCGPISEPGYYYLNSSEYNTNVSCIVIASDNVIFDFKDKLIDGEPAYTFANDGCGLTVVNSSEVSVINGRLQEFSKGICILNSNNVTLTGGYSSANKEGIYFEDSNKITMSDINISNAENEIYMVDSKGVFINLETTNAKFDLEAKNVKITKVTEPPENPANLLDIEQWIEMKNLTASAWANLKFIYVEPLPNNVFSYSLRVWKYNNLTGWILSSEYSNVDVLHQKVYTTNITNFSIFAPVGIELPEQEKNNTEIQKEVINEGGGEGSGKGGSAEDIEPQERIPKVNLTLIDKYLTVPQGESFKIKYNVTNIGEVDITGLIVAGYPPSKWRTSNATINKLDINESEEGYVYFEVPETAVPTEYVISVKALNFDTPLDIETFRLIVTPLQKLKRLRIVEMAPRLTLIENMWHDLPIFVENNGDFNLTNITLKLEYSEDCIELIEGSYNLESGEKSNFVYSIRTKDAGGSCDSIAVLESKEGVIAFAPISIEVISYPIFGFPILLVITIMWTILVIYTGIKKYYVR